MLIYLLRHGQTEFNKLGIIQGSSVDTDLNDEGRAQADAFFEMYKDVDFQLVVTSALKRTHQTVQRFIDSGIDWRQTPDINEIRWGDYEGQRISPEWDAVWSRVREAWNDGDLDARMPGGESAADLNARLLRFIEWLQSRPEERVLICSHGRTMRGLISLLKGVTLADMEGVSHANTGCYVMRYDGRRYDFLEENSLRHL
jgi:phosphoserine phosphatase